ncbi:MAG: thiolase family protein [Deltaproteobacteria bacterium]|nr:thiolase family protein [Deltaproteobacteria bacterium]
MRDAVIVQAVRTAIGRAGRGTLKDTRPDEFGAECMQEVMKRTPQVKPDEIEDLIVGNAMPEGAQGMNFARILGCRAGLPDHVPAITINRFCSSGLNAIAMAAEKIAVGYVDVVMAGGVESMTMIPMGGFNPSMNPHLMEVWPEVYTPMGVTAENVAKKFNVTRAQQDEYAYHSHMKAVKAIKEGKFKSQLLPLKVKVYGADEKTGKPTVKDVVFDTDESPRPDTTIDGLSKLRPVFAQDGSVTAGNSSPMNDGAAFTIVMDAETAKKKGLKPMAYFRHFAVVGTPPEIMGVGPLYAIRKLFEKTGLKAGDIDLYEINEAFASQAYYCCTELGLPMDRVNVNGGAIALGHPLGCTGAKLTTQLLYEMEQRNARWGVVAMCIGGGMGAAGLFERVKN